ncbi:hypothetical protein PTTG_28726 [Puccinia triticina 1-1 BBBD Race 1]|uniref:Uncharacterized protein n=1 Tax=Puccinia triticina (isolate 1-1 / race 1 (BBBD)) TaxID=630390 RepID=A0A180G9L5_PUCT1|nr:hypothetical protein PTTG_28726 [Puccinia triticina 1-1 BBBD Race 1]WAR60873.1 hypothetical protein PtB15_13B119 [Puccinia triticina]WAR60876.1 hypothetical protein PtB15_13B123 [Puccinia triticina]
MERLLCSASSITKPSSAEFFERPFGGLKPPISIGWSTSVLMASLEEGRVVRAWLPLSIFIRSSDVPGAGLNKAAGSWPLAGSILSLSSGFPLWHPSPASPPPNRLAPLHPPLQTFNIKEQYRDPIAWLNKRGSQRVRKLGRGVLTLKDGVPVKAPERLMPKTLGVSIFLINFPKEVKALLHEPYPWEQGVHQECTVDVLIPGVAEIVGKSIHMARYGQLLAADKGFGIPAELYYGTGTCPGYAIRYT